MSTFVAFLLSAPVLAVTTLATMFGLNRLFQHLGEAEDNSDLDQATEERKLVDIAMETAVFTGRFYSPEYGLEIIYERGCYRVFIARGPHHWMVYPCDEAQAHKRITQQIEEITCLQSTAAL